MSESVEPPAVAAGRDPWHSAYGSMNFPGLGQFENGQRALGLAFAAGMLACLAAALVALASPSIPLGVFGLAVLGAVAIVLASVLQSIGRARSLRPDAAPATVWRSAFWSRFLPGLGQLTERRLGAGFAFLAGSLVLASLGYGVMPRLASGALAVVAVWDSLAHSKRPQPARAEVRRALVATGVVLLVAAVVPAALRARYVQAFHQPSASMEPTLLPGDYFVVDRTRAARAEAGDLVAFRYPQDRRKMFLKRCVATAGQSVELRDKQLLLDGRAIAEPYVRHRDPETRPAGADPRDNLGPYVVPRGQVFLLGDNRDDSNDSRYFGPVPLDDVLGRAVRIYWPPSRWSVALLPARDVRELGESRVAPADSIHSTP
jgi:signal peptidase I